MARRTFHVIDITEILIHWYAGRSQHELAASLKLDRKTIRRYVAPAVAAGITLVGRRGARSSGRSWCGAGSRIWWTPGCGR
jgi:predicted DNA-binding transcriptional regulator YafY